MVLEVRCHLPGLIRRFARYPLLRNLHGRGLSARVGPIAPSSAIERQLQRQAEARRENEQEPSV